MSTKKIREALEQLDRWRATQGQPSMNAEALAEVEAIEQMAKALSQEKGCGIAAAWDGDAWIASEEELKTLEPAAKTIESIARDAP